MTTSPTLDASSFSEARTNFEALVQDLQSGPTVKMTHDAVEGVIASRGREILRQLLQGHLECRSALECRESMVGSDGELRSHQRQCERQLTSVFGDVEVTRTELRARGVSGGLRPLDAELNLPPDLYSFGLHRLIAWFAANEAYDAVVDSLTQCTGLRLGKRQVEEAAIRSTADFDSFYAGTDEPKAKSTSVLVLSFDGKGVVMRPESLRPGTRKAAKRKNHLEHRLSPGEKNGRKRMAEVATVYELEAVARTAADIMSELDGEGKGRPKAFNKRVWASLEKDQGEVVADAFHEAEGRDLEHERRWVVLVDGNAHQLRCVKAEARRIGVEPTLILDIIHVIEYLWKAAWCIHAKGDPAAEQWVRARVQRLLEGDVSGVAAGIRRSATKRKLSDEERSAMDICANYLLKYKAMLRYDRYLAQGMPIATGVIEGACRHLVQDRMDITGARWGLDGAEAVLKLRALRSSGDFEAYWDYHLSQEQKRNHLFNFANHELPHLRAVA